MRARADDRSGLLKLVQIYMLCRHRNGRLQCITCVFCRVKPYAGGAYRPKGNQLFLIVRNAGFGLLSE
jgi:hypothetical protein